MSSQQELTRVSMKKTASGDKSYFDFDFSNDFLSTDTIDPNQVAVTIVPSGELVLVSGIVINGLRLQCTFNATGAVAAKEYLVQVKAVSSSGKDKTISTIICVN